MPAVACIMMQKDEDILLEPWLTYHGHLFGMRNLYVIDNGSTLPAVRATLERFSAVGVHVDYDHPTREDYLHKGDIVGAVIRQLDAAGTHDFFFPCDCDEFIIKQTAFGFTCDFRAIHAYLETLKGEVRTLRIPYQIANSPLFSDFYSYFEFKKTFFAAGAFDWTDHGHHADGSRNRLGFRDTLIVHAHFHFYPFARYLEMARRKWNGSVSPDALDLSGQYAGDSMHLAPYFRMTAADYYHQFYSKALFYLPQLRGLLRRLGSALNFPLEEDPHLTLPDTGEASRIPLFLPFLWNEQAYLAGNRDVQNAGLNGVFHFVSFGRQEGRTIPPFEPADMAKAPLPQPAIIDTESAASASPDSVPDAVPGANAP